MQPAHGYAKSTAMPTDPKPHDASGAENTTDRTGPARPLTPVAERALAEAIARRAEREHTQASRPKESGGRGGLEPTRYGDWEKDGLASDF